MTDLTRIEQLELFPSSSPWIRIRDGNIAARALYRRHYSCRIYRDGRDPAKFIGPGEYIALVTPFYDALFVWRKFISDDGQRGVNCAVFRNEGSLLSSNLILEAEKWATAKWGDERLYTYINPHKIKSRNPGYCFLIAGWQRCGMSKGGLVILEKLP